MERDKICLDRRSEVPPVANGMARQPGEKPIFPLKRINLVRLAMSAAEISRVVARQIGGEQRPCNSGTLELLEHAERLVIPTANEAMMRVEQERKWFSRPCGLQLLTRPIAAQASRCQHRFNFKVGEGR